MRGLINLKGQVMKHLKTLLCVKYKVIKCHKTNIF